MRTPLTAIALLATGCFFGYRPAGGADGHRVHRGRFINDLVLTGEVEAASGELITMPRLSAWQTSIKWLAPDGAQVRKGDPVAELDNGPFVADLDKKQQAAIQAERELTEKNAQIAADLADKSLDADRKKVELEKATIDASIPKDLLSRRDYEDRQTKLERAKVEYEKARDLLVSQTRVGRDQRANLEITLERARRELKEAEDGITALTLRAPRDGMIVIHKHTFEPRKLRIGDVAVIGMAIAQMPDPASLRVEAALADVDDGRIRAGMPATVVLDSYLSTVYTGRVTQISPVAQESAATSTRRAFQVIIALDRVDPSRMRPGLSARVTVHRDDIADALLVPRGAVDFAATKPRVRLAGGDLSDVTLGPCNALECVVLGGLREGERVRG